MENGKPVKASKIVAGVIKFLTQKRAASPSGAEPDISVEDIKASIEDRRRLRETMRHRWLVK